MIKGRKVLTLPNQFQNSVSLHENQPALGFVGEKAKTYREMNSDIQALMAWMEKLGIKQGDKIAILSSNMPNWGIAYYAISFMGAVAVPLLPDFSPVEIENILQHSEAKAIFISDGLHTKLDGHENNHLQYYIAIEQFSVLNTISSEIPSYQANEKPRQVYAPKEDDLATIIYTSGTTGKSKGVMLSHKNITYTAIKTQSIQPVHPDDRFLSILPLSHTYENTLGFILPTICGAAVYYLRKAPTASVLLPALKSIQPTLMLSVPLIIEKMYRNKILPGLTEKWHMRVLYRLPVMRKKMNQIAGKKLMETFGGQLKFFGIGGAKLDKKVEKFLKEARFPYAIGYGLTETAPLLAGVNPQTTRIGTTGPAMEGVQLKIHNPDRISGEGEIWAKGPNVMKGYYKDPEITREVLTEDGWFKTGDLGVFDKDNFLYIRGRVKNMIIGENGENIYPEDIESVINNFRHVAESIVIQKKGKLVALVHFNKEEIEQQYQELKSDVSNYFDLKMEELRTELQEYINSRVNRFSRVQAVMVYTDPFEKTATHKIKRFLYT